MGKSIMNRFTLFGDWLYFLLILQISWLMGLILGGIVLGIFPATYATFAVARKRLRGEVKIRREFWSVYQSYFLMSQIQGWIWILLGMFIYYDVRILFSYQSLLGFIAGSLFVSILIMYGLCSMLLLPIYSNYELTVLNRIRLSLIIAITFPHISVGLSLGSIVIYFIATKIPILFLLIGVSLTALLYTFLASYAFRKVEERGFISSVDRIVKEQS